MATAGVAVLVLLVQGAPGAATLPPPNAKLDAEFTRIVAVRELADRRVLVTDAGEQKLYVADFTTNSVTMVGREGRGPEEYRSAGQLHALAGDSTLLVDVAGGRWLLLHGANIVQTVRADAPALREGARLPVGADVRGNVLATRAIGTPPGGPPPAIPRTDSTYLVRVSRATGRADTVASLFARPTRIAVQGPSDRPTSISVTVNPLAAGDLATIFSDGTIAIARVAPYRVDWITPAGAFTRGTPLPFTRLAVTLREKEAVLKRQAQQSGRAARSPDSVQDWPDILPPFLTGALLPAPDGRLWIRRTPSADEPGIRYDIVPRTGALAARLTLSPNEHVVGFGRNTVYSVLTDADGLQHLRRHSFPR